jgi:hypothetical protein
MVPALPMIRAITAAFSLAVLAATAVAQEAREIRFAPRSNSSTVSGSVVRGTRDIYSFSARKGQTARIDVSAVESNAAITVWRPGARPGPTDDDIEGTTLPGAGEGQDAQRWFGLLPETGRYIIVVGPTRGNATYQLRLGIVAQSSKQPASTSSHPPK